MKKVYVMIFSFAILNLLDLITTVFGVSLGAVELNGITSFFISNGYVVEYKIFGGLFACFLLWYSAKQSEKNAKRVHSILTVSCLVYCYIVLMNTYACLTLLGVV